MADPLTALTIVGTAVKAGSSLVGGMQESRQLQFQAQQAETQARLENLRAKEQANLIRDQLNKDLASANATFAARGVLSTSGSAQQAQVQSRAAASRDIETALFGGRANASQLRSQAAEFRSGAKGARVGGFINAANAIGSSKGGRAAFSLLKGMGEDAPPGTVVVGSSPQSRLRGRTERLGGI